MAILTVIAPFCTVFGATETAFTETSTLTREDLQMLNSALIQCSIVRGTANEKENMFVPAVSAVSGLKKACCR